METSVSSTLDPTKITGMYKLLGAILAVTETLLGVWFFRAGGGVERSIAGVLMTTLLLVFLLVVVRWNIKKGEEKGAPKVEGIGTLKLPDKQVTAEQISSPEPESYVGPDRSYIIHRPPEDWKTKELTVTEWRTNALEITDSSIASFVEQLEGKDRASKEKAPRDIVVFEKTLRTSVIPLPGQTTINGRKVLTALEIPLPTSLAIRPMDRARPPLFMERPLIHNFIQEVHAVIGVMTLHNQWSNTIPNSQRKRWVAELSQVVENATVNGQEGRSLTNNIVVVGIEGDIQDFILIMQYTSLKEGVDPALTRDHEILNSLMNSFRPIKVPNVEAIRKEFKDKADQNFEEVVKRTGKDAFRAEFGAYLYRLFDKDLADLDNRLKAMKMIKPFKVFAEQIDFSDEDLDKLWISLEEAEKGDTLSFKENLEGMIKISKEAIAKATENQASPDVEGTNGPASDEQQA